MTVEQEYPTASLRRRLAAQTYDFFLLFALWAVTGSILLMVFGDSDARGPSSARTSTAIYHLGAVDLLRRNLSFLFLFLACKRSVSGHAGLEDSRRQQRRGDHGR